MSLLGAFLCTTSAAWHGVNAYYFCMKSSAFVRTYRLTDERTESLASDVISWYGGLHAVISAYALVSSLRILSLKKVDMQIPMVLGAVGLSQGILVNPNDKWRPELKWITIISSSLAFAHLSLAFFLYRRSSSGLFIDIINNIQNFINSH